MKKYEIKVEGATLTIIPRSYNNSYKNDYFKSPRMYVSVADESIMDNLANRKRRPYNVYKTLIHSSNIKSALDLSKLSWSQNAGCAMCPCSPGFVLNPQALELEGDTVVRFDVWVKLDNAPAVNETKPARVLVGI